MKLYFCIDHPSATSIRYTISGVEEAPKPASTDPDSQFVIHNGKIYPVRPEVIQ